MSIISIILVAIVAFLAGLDGIIDEFMFHQPIVNCTLIGLATGHAKECIILGGTLQMIALGWANIGAAVSPDAALCGTAAAVLFVLGGAHTKDIGNFIGTAILLSLAGLFLTMIVRTISIGIVHAADAAAKKADLNRMNILHLFALLLQGLRIAVPVTALCFVPSEAVINTLKLLPAWFTDGMAIGGGMVVAVGYAIVINMIATKEVWPFFMIGFAIAALSGLTLIAIGLIGLALALIYISLSKQGSGAGAGGSGDPLGDILNDY
jgi:PTS system mannose-specific IIC component